MPNKIKQVIVMRTDTDPPMRKGKMVAQGAHASLAFLTRKIQQASGRSGSNVWELLGLTSVMREWMESSFAKICVRVDSEEELFKIFNEAKQAGLEANLITDSGLTEFGKPTNTCLAIGPDLSEKIDKITGHLKLL